MAPKRQFEPFCFESGLKMVTHEPTLFLISSKGNNPNVDEFETMATRDQSKDISIIATHFIFFFNAKR